MAAKRPKRHLGIKEGQVLAVACRYTPDYCRYQPAVNSVRRHEQIGNYADVDGGGVSHHDAELFHHAPGYGQDVEAEGEHAAAQGGEPGGPQYGDG